MVVLRRCWYHDDGMILMFLAMYHVHVFVPNLKPQMLFIFTSCAMKFYGYLDHHPWIEMFRTATHFVVQYSSSVFPLLCGCFNLQYIPQDKHVFYRYFSMTWLTWLSYFFVTATTTTLWYIILHAMYVWYMYTVYMYDICIQWYVWYMYLWYIILLWSTYNILLHLSSLLQAVARRQQTSICTEREILTDVARKLNQVIHPDPKRDVYRSCRCMMMLEYVGWDVIQWPID